MGDAKESIDIYRKEIENIKDIVQNVKTELLLLDKEIEHIEQHSHTKGFRNFLVNLKKLVIRIDIKSGVNILKLVLWMAMAGTIVYYSSDINAKLISALTYFLGIMIDMALLRKQLPKVGNTTIRVLAGVCVIVFCGIIVMLILGLMASALDLELPDCADKYIGLALFICGFASTFLEFINSIAIDD